MRLPNAEYAVANIRKLCDYCLNPQHDEGKHKARLFAAALGITSDHAEELREALLQAIKTHEAHLGRCDAYGQRYFVDFIMFRQDKYAMIRSAWIIEHDSEIPRLTTCYPL